MHDAAAPRDDHDSPWKEALSKWFPDFMGQLFPKIHTQIDWPRGHEFLDTELQKIMRDAETGRQYVDKLVKLCLLDGSEQWVLVHVEVQGEPEAKFAERMYLYNARIFDRYREKVASLAVLTDDSDGFRPDCFKSEVFGLRLLFQFEAVKLKDWCEPERWQELEASDNVFALVVMAQIKARQTHDPDERKAFKFMPIRMMYDRGYERAIILEIFRIIDWILRLPKALNRDLLQEVHEFEESRKMVYITSVEQIGIEKGLQRGEAAVLLRLIERKFGTQAVETHRDRIEAADAETLLSWSERILSAVEVEEIFQP